MSLWMSLDTDILNTTLIRMEMRAGVAANFELYTAKSSFAFASPSFSTRSMSITTTPNINTKLIPAKSKYIFAGSNFVVPFTHFGTEMIQDELRFKYASNNVYSNGKKSWKCLRSNQMERCKAYIRTRGNYIIGQFHEHNHLP